MSTRPTYRESECKVEKLKMERESFQEAISAVSHFYYAIDADAIELQCDQFNQPVCYSWTHKRSTPCNGEERPSFLKITEKQNHRVRWNLPNMITGDDPNF